MIQLYRTDNYTRFGNIYKLRVNNINMSGYLRLIQLWSLRSKSVISESVVVGIFIFIFDKMLVARMVKQEIGQ